MGNHLGKVGFETWVYFFGSWLPGGSVIFGITKQVVKIPSAISWAAFDELVLLMSPYTSGKNHLSTPLVESGNKSSDQK